MYGPVASTAARRDLGAGVEDEGGGVGEGVGGDAGAQAAREAQAIAAATKSANLHNARFTGHSCGEL